MQDFKNLKVWAKAHEWVLTLYAATASFPREERYGLTAQMRSAAVSIPSNLAEGCGRGGLPELIQFSQVAFGSATELEYQLLLARDLNYLEESAYQELLAGIGEIKRMLGALLTTLRNRTGKPRTKGHKGYLPANGRRPTETLTHRDTETL